MIKEYKIQAEQLLTTHKTNLDSYTKELNNVNNKYETLNNFFIEHLKDTEKELLSIITENTTVFKNIVSSNEGITAVLKLLIDSIDFPY